MLAANVLQDPDLHTRLAATLVLAEMPESAEIGAGALSREPEARELHRQVAEPRVLHRGDCVTERRSRRRTRPTRTRCRSTRCRWRCGSARSSPTGARRTRRTSRPTGRTCRCPGNWESRGLPDFDGVVWFTRTVDVPAAPRRHRDAVARRDAEHRRGLGQRPARSRPPGGGRGGAAAGAAVRRRLRAAGGHAAAGREPDHGSHPERAQRRRLHRHAGADVPRGRRQQDAARRAVEVPRRASDQRRRALHEAGRARGARRVHRRRRPRRRGRRERSSRSRRRRRTSSLRLARCPGPAEVRPRASSPSRPGSSSRSSSRTPTRCSTTSCSAPPGSLDAIGAAADKLATVAGGPGAAVRAGHSAGALLDQAGRAGTRP